MMMTLTLCIDATAQEPGLGKDRKDASAQETPWYDLRFSPSLEIHRPDSWSEDDLIVGLLENHSSQLLGQGGVRLGPEANSAAFELDDGQQSPLVVATSIAEAGLPREQITVAAWVRIDRPRPWAGMISAIQDNGNDERGWVLGTNAQGTRFLFGLTSESKRRLTYLEATSVFKLKQWHHVVGVFDGKQQRLYVNGRLAGVSNEQQGEIIYPQNGRFVLGAYEDSTESHPIRGSLGRCTLWNQALSSAAIREFYEQSRGLRVDIDAELEPVKPNRDWTTYRGNSGRTGYCDVSLPSSLQLAWSREGTPPSPAWPPPASKSYWQNLDRIEARVVDDQAIHPVLAEEFVLTASSANDVLECFDVRTGESVWRFIADGPLRFAPAIWQDNVLLASDDGKLRCLALADGTLRWETTVGPDAPFIPGNGRLISPYPLRSGVLVRQGIAYVCAGLFPSQGVFAAAYDIETGREQWHRDLGDRSPQGHLLATDEWLIVPSGRGNPFSLKLSDGSDGPQFGGVGGTFAVIADDSVIAGRGNDNSLVQSRIESGERLVTFPGEHLVVLPRQSIVANREQIACIDRARSNELKQELAELDLLIKADDAPQELLTRRTEVEAAIGRCLTWTRTSDRVLAMAACRNFVVVGLPSAIEIRSPETGEVVRRFEVDGEARSIAITEQGIVVTTSKGSLFVFRDSNLPALHVEQHRASMELTSRFRTWASERISTADTKRGFLLIAEPSLEQLIALRELSEFKVLAICQEKQRRDRLRDNLLKHNCYGSRITVLHSSLDRIPIADWIANVLIDDRSLVPDSEKRRCAAPGRSVVWTRDQSMHPPRLVGAGEWTHQFANLSNTANSGDAYTNRRLTLQWFGGPGPRRMVDRHLRAPPPLAAGGRTFVVGENRLIGVDSYNGTELWDTALPDSQRYAMPYDAGYIACRSDSVFVAVDEQLWQLDSASGSIVRKSDLPSELPAGCHWGYVGVDGSSIFATAVAPSAPRTTPGRHLSDQTYRSELPLVTSRAFFRFDHESQELVWSYQGGSILNPSILVHESHIFFIESRGEQTGQDDAGRLRLSDAISRDAWLVALDAETGRKRWEKPFDNDLFRNVIYLVGKGDQVVMVGSRDSQQRDAEYHLVAFQAESGELRWQQSHSNHQPGQLYHGEQVHHPVVLQDSIVAEPFLYRWQTGEPIVPPGEPDGWRIRRPGHSCGTMSGAGHCLFFRAGNPTVLDLSADRETDESDRFQALSPSRVGCWINILPADGLVIIPEASSSCVCHYALQTSMAFRPLQFAGEGSAGSSRLKDE